MSQVTERPECPHCGQQLQAFTLPVNTGWTGDIQFACFNDECPYYKRGWKWMQEQYSVRSSYRYRLDPETGEVSPLAVWSPDAIKDRIVDAEITVTRVPAANDSKTPEGESQ